MDDVVVLGISSARHSCKVCGKGFPCGRSLGGHMRSHSLAEVAMADDDEERGANGAVPESGYGLRENPKKTRRLLGLDDGSEDDECHGDRGELFSSSCEPTLDDVRRHASIGEDYAAAAAAGERNGEALDDEEHMRLIPTEAAVLMPAPRRRRRSMRVPAPAPAPPPRDAFDREQAEDVALCLIMLSRDTPAARRKRSGYYHYHDADSSDDASAAFFHPYGGDVETSHKTKQLKRKQTAPCGGDEKRSARYECPGCGRAFQSYQALGGHRASHKRINSSCCITKVALDQPEPSAETTSFSTASASSPASPEADRAAAVKAKRMNTTSKFECPICFKVFSSGQALGGHKRSHSIAGELYERADAGIVEPEQSLVAAQFLDLNLPAPGDED